LNPGVSGNNIARGAITARHDDTSGAARNGTRRAGQSVTQTETGKPDRSQFARGAQLPGALRRLRLRSSGTVRLVGIGLIVAAAYVLGARIGFHFAFVAEQVTTVWAPTGVGIASLLLWGVSLWPAVWAGAFIANASSTAPLWTAAAVATGNTLEAVAASWALLRLARFDPGLRRIRDSLWFITIAAAASTTISASVGVITLCASGVQPWDRFGQLWWDWWLGDAVGALVVAPVILTVARRRPWSARESIESCLLMGSAVLGMQVVFGRAFGSQNASHPLEYVIFPFVVAAAVRGGLPLTSLMVLGASGIAIWHTAHGAGPFAGAAAHDSLVQLQVFVGVLAGTGLLLAAAIAERQTGERRRAAGHAVGQVLARAPDFSTAAPVLLESICESLEWQIGVVWLADEHDRQLHCLAVWTEPRMSASSFAAATRNTVFAPGIGLPGRVLASGKAAWIENVDREPNFPRAAVAREAGVHGAFGFPICLGEEVLAVIECFNRIIVPPDPDLLQTLSAVGNQIGQFIHRTRQESAVAEEQRRTAAILDTALDAIIGMDHRGVITEFNPAAVNTFGYTRDAAVGRDLADLLIPPHLRELHRAGLARFLTTGTGPFIDKRVETVACHADGHTFPVEVAVTRVSDDAPPRFSGFVRDLTVRMKAEQEREELLRREAAARDEAETASRAKDEFLATLSHELRTPVNAIAGWTRMLLDGTMDPRHTRRALEVIDRNAQLQAQLVEDILDVSRIIGGGLQVDFQRVDVVAVITAALDAVRPTADAKRVTLSFPGSGSSRVVQGDFKRLEQIVWNLLANAVKFSEAGGLVTAELIDAGPDRVQIRISDNGMGIDPRFLPHVFERFRQADGSTSRRHGGLGLGLAIVRHLVELHGGTVRAESPGLGKGATFSIELSTA
jgi:PAS domain S-box-containing protein